MIKLSDLDKSVVHDFYELYEKDENEVYQLVANGRFDYISSFIDTLERPYYIERFTYTQYVPKKKEG